jgi:2-polyprenyl-3-methyl-5-hydroxy-6-metoxy-1,4-benzoquinol methylase
MDTRVLCQLCDRDTFQIFSARDYRRPFDRTEYRICWCHECALGRIAGDFSREEVSKFYQIDYYTHMAADVGADAKNAYKNSFKDRLVVRLAWRLDNGVALTPDELGAASNRSLCDIGCGAGAHLKCFGEAGFRVMGTEPDPIARKRAGQFAQVFDGTAETLPHEISVQRFDVVLLTHVLEHCINIRQSIANVRSIISPNGTVVVEVPNNAAKAFSVFGAEWPWADIPRHLNFFTEKSLRRVLEMNGFSVKSVQYVGYTRQFVPEWKVAQATIHREIRNDEPYPGAPSFWWLLQTAFASASRKYDSVRILASPTA